uniref:Retrovirus-related Pol polyprotein from transposon TNT 1-94 n=1 Tax=Cajanus cajan TaxID=3821 RepID=A0A151QM58_CAJCA|nr:Retrovirus-related Pol polyprotein from transposon TNT 1-94 [Cajanus cajan]
MKRNAKQHETIAGNDKIFGDQQWVLDSGASHHMTPLFSLLKGVKNLEKPFYITIPTRNTVFVEKTGFINLNKDIKLNNVLFVPDFSCNLISIHQLTNDLNCTVTYHANYCVIQDQNTKRIIGLGDLHDGVYVLKRITQGISLVVVRRDATTLWHARMGHPSAKTLQCLSRLLKCSFDFNKVDCCDIFHKSKQCRLPFNQSDYKATKSFALIHCDLWGRYRTTSNTGSHYFLTIVDDFTRGTWAYLLKTKVEVVGILMSFCNMVKTQFNTKVKRFRSDNRTKFTNVAIQQFFQQEGIMHETSCVGTPKQNGRVERKHRHILNVTRALRFQANLPISFWGECVLTATYIINRTPTVANE